MHVCPWLGQLDVNHPCARRHVEIVLGLDDKACQRHTRPSDKLIILGLHRRASMSRNTMVVFFLLQSSHRRHIAPLPSFPPSVTLVAAALHLIFPHRHCRVQLLSHRLDALSSSNSHICGPRLFLESPAHADEHPCNPNPPHPQPKF
jgi:hypothetical protein